MEEKKGGGGGRGKEKKGNENKRKKEKTGKGKEKEEERKKSKREKNLSVAARDTAPQRPAPLLPTGGHRTHRWRSAARAPPRCRGRDSPFLANARGGVGEPRAGNESCCSLRGHSPSGHLYRSLERAQG